MLVANLLLLLAAVPPVPATPLKVAMLPLNAGAGVKPEVASALGETLAAELRRVGGVQLVTEAEIKAVLSLEAQQSLAGCAEDACLADVGAALGVDLLVTGSIARPGESWLAHIRVLDAKRVAVVAQSDRRVKTPSVDGVVDELPGMAAELGRALAAMAASRPVVAASPTAPAPAAPAPTAAPAPDPAPTAVAAPPPFVDEPFANGKVRDRLRVATDGQGWFVAYDPSGDFDTPLLAGTERALWAQRRISGGKDGEGGWSAAFWEPRVQAGYQRSLDHDKSGTLTLTCGERSIKLTPLDAAASRARLAAAELRAPRWRRAVLALAVDDEGTYYYVDQAREAQGDELQPRLFVGRKGKVSYVPVEDAVLGRDQQIFMTARGRLKLVSSPARAEWITTGATTPLQVLDTYSQAAFIYTKLGAYADALGTACDPYLGAKPTR